MNRKIRLFLEFFVFALAMGILEDIVAVGVVTGKPITIRTLGIVTLVAIPFALIGEVLASRYQLFQNNKKISK